MSPVTRTECLRIATALGAVVSASKARGKTTAKEAQRLGVRLTRAAQHQSEDVVRRHLPLLQAQGQLACGPGCDHCCYGQQVDVTHAEADTIVDFLARTLPGAELNAFALRVQQEARDTSTLSLDARAFGQRACLLLDPEQKRCRVYEVRPLSCRAHNSLDAERCQVGKEHPERDPHVPFNRTWRMLGEMVQFAYQLVLTRRGQDSSGYELASALAQALARRGH